MEYFIVFLPLLGAFIAGFFGNKFDQKYSQFMTSLFVSISSILSIIVFLKVLNYGYSNNLLISSWINSGTLNVNWSIKVDALSSLMMVVVTLVSALSISIQLVICLTILTNRGLCLIYLYLHLQC